MGKIVHYYRRTDTPHSLLPSLVEQLALASGSDGGGASSPSVIASVETESCFNVQLSSDLDGESTSRLEWLLRETFERDGLKLEESTFGSDASCGSDGGQATAVMEFGPRMTFTSAFSSNATGICGACGLTAVTRLERSRRYRFTFTQSPSDSTIGLLKKMLHDRMTEEEYVKPIETFESGAKTEPTVRVPIMAEGRKALERINEERGLGFDEFDLDFYTELFKVRLT